MLVKTNLSNNYIEFLKFDDNSMIIKDIYIDYEYPKLFFLVIKLAVEQLHEKKINKIYQWVSKYDWENILKNTKWKLHKEEEDYLIVCDTNEFLDCILESLDIKI